MSAIYLDANATSQPLPQARAALLQAADLLGNPSSPHRAGRQARRLLDQARDAVARAMGGKAADVVFTSGASEANRWLLDALRASFPNRPPRVWTTPFEHPSVSKPLAEAAATGAIALEVAPLDGAQVDVSAAKRAEVVFCSAAHSETGILLDLPRLLAELPAETLLFVDASQTLGRLEAPKARADAVVCSAHKFGGYSGVGALLLRHRAKTLLRAPWRGGGQEDGLRPGTEPVVLIAAMGAAAIEIEATRVQNGRLAPMRDALEAQVLGALLALGTRAQVVGAKVPRLPQTSAIMFPGTDGEALRMLLDDAGLQVGFGSACSAMAPEPSAALLALGLTPRQARATVRLSLPLAFAVETSSSEQLEALIGKIVGRLVKAVVASGE